MVISGSLLRPQHVLAAPVFSLVPSGTTFFSTQASGIDPAPQTIAVSNGGSDTLDWQVASAASWVTLTPTTGGPGPATVTVQAKNNLPAGTYTADVYFTSTNVAGITGSVTFTYTVNATVVLSVDKTSYSFKAIMGKPGKDQFLTVQSGSVAGWTGAIKPGASWLSITPNNGTVYNDVTAPVHIKVDATALGIGTYTGTITISSAGAVPSSIDITVTLKVTPFPIMEATPRPLNATIDEGRTDNPTIAINNSGASETELNWSMNQPAEPWIKLSLTGGCSGPFPSPISGFAAGGRNSTVTVCLTTLPPAAPPLTPGGSPYTTTLTVSAPDAVLLSGGADTIPVTLTVVSDVTKATVTPNSVFYGHFDTGTFPVSKIKVEPSSVCGSPPTYNIEISWTSSEYGNTRFKWGEQLVGGVPQYERGTILMPEGLDTLTHVGGTLYHTVTLSNINYLYCCLWIWNGARSLVWS